MAIQYKKYIEQPTASINIVSTAVTDVTEYTTAQVVDADLVAGNIKKDINILGVVGTYEGIVPSGNKELQQQTGTDVTNYATASVKSGSATTPATTQQQSAPTFTQSGNIVTANVAATSVSVTPDIEEGWVAEGTAGTVTMSANSAEYTIPTQTKSATANGTVSPDSGYLLSSVTVAIPVYDGSVS